MARKNSKTAEQRKAEREALLATLADKVAALASSEEWVAYLGFIAAFRKYSFNNLMLIAAQCPNATHVAGYRKWQQLGPSGPQGRAGDQDPGLLHQEDHPHRPRDRRRDRGPAGPLSGAVGVRHLPDRRRPDPGRPLPAAYRRRSRRRARPAQRWLTGEGWTLREVPLAGTCEGYTDHVRRIIVTETNLEPAARLVVLLHEAAHAVLHGELDAGRVPGTPRSVRDRSRIHRLRAGEPARPRRRRQLDQLRRRLVTRRSVRAHRSR